MAQLFVLPHSHPPRRNAQGTIPRENESPIQAAGPRPATLPRSLIDSHGRTIRDLRLSITDRCNFRCVYCMDPDVRFADPRTLMSVEEMTRAVRACLALGVQNVRLTGGEPTVHPKLTEIIGAIAALGVQDLSMTSNGSLCTRDKLREWKAAGLKRLTFSLDSLTPETFDAMTRSASSHDACGGVHRVIEAISLAIEEGFAPVKVNAVVIRGRNEQEVPKLVALAKNIGFEMRFIEYMPLDSGHHWDRNLLVPADEIVLLASQAAELKALDRADPHSTSETYIFADLPPAHPARIGIIAPVTRPFCGQCSRLRITADAKIRPCLFSLQEFDLMAHFRHTPGMSDTPGMSESSSESRGSSSDLDLENALLTAVWSKQKGHGITSADFVQPDRPMSAIGG